MKEDSIKPVFLIPGNIDILGQILCKGLTVQCGMSRDSDSDQLGNSSNHHMKVVKTKMSPTSARMSQLWHILSQVKTTGINKDS